MLPADSDWERLVSACCLIHAGSGPRFVDLADFAFAAADNFKKIASKLDRFSLGICRKDGEAADYFFCFRKRTVCDGEGAVIDSNEGAERGWHATLRGKQLAALESVFDQLTHAGHF